MSLPACAICFDPFSTKEKIPYSLSCGHSFCYDCLNGSSNANCIISKCPTCRKVLNVSIKGIPANFSLIESIGILKDLIPSPSPSESGSNSDSGLGSDLGASVQSIPIRLPRCPKHKSEQAIFFCTDCKSVACPFCVINDSVHSGHVVQETAKVARREAKSARRRIQEALDGTQALLNTIIIDQKSVISDMDEVSTTIATYVSKGIAKMREREERLYDMLENAAAKRNVHNNELINTMNKRLTTIKALEQSIEGMDDATVLEKSSVFKWTELNTQPLYSPFKFAFQFNRHKLDNAIDDLGTPEDWRGIKF